MLVFFLTNFTSCMHGWAIDSSRESETPYSWAMSTTGGGFFLQIIAKKRKITQFSSPVQWMDTPWQICKHVVSQVFQQPQACLIFVKIWSIESNALYGTTQQQVNILYMQLVHANNRILPYQWNYFSQYSHAWLLFYLPCPLGFGINNLH